MAGTYALRAPGLRSDAPPKTADRCAGLGWRCNQRTPCGGLMLHYYSLSALACIAYFKKVSAARKSTGGDEVATRLNNEVGNNATIN